MPNPRAAKVSERIHEIVASLVTTRLKDPRLEMVTITDVRVTGDLQHATIFYTVYGGEKKLAEAGRGLASAKGFLRSQVGAQLGLRLTPSLDFVPDALPETARSLEGCPRRGPVPRCSDRQGIRGCRMGRGRGPVPVG